MTNKDKYLKDGVDVKEFVEEIGNYYQQCAGNGLGFKKIAEMFMRAPATPSLTEDEKVILMNIKGFELIYRNSSGTLHFVTRRNTEVNHYCEGGIFRDAEIEDGECVSCINHLFQFIKPRRRI